MNVCIIYGVDAKTPYLNYETILKIVKDGAVAKAWLKAYEDCGLWKSLRYECWSVEDKLPLSSS